MTLKVAGAKFAYAKAPLRVMRCGVMISEVTITGVMISGVSSSEVMNSSVLDCAAGRPTLRSPWIRDQKVVKKRAFFDGQVVFAHVSCC